jgi:hypothetical protein
MPAETICLSDIEKMLSSLSAYPEGPIKIHGNQTPLHAAARVGNKLVLKVLIKDIESRKAKI